MSLYPVSVLCLRILSPHCVSVLVCACPGAPAADTDPGLPANSGTRALLHHPLSLTEKTALFLLFIVKIPFPNSNEIIDSGMRRRRPER